MPRSRALAINLSRDRPLPSSRTSMRIEPPWCEALKVMVPVSGLPLARRSCGVSMPWSQLLRTRCVSGSVIFSTRPLSSSVASPCVTSSTFLSSFAARSRSMRGKRLKTIDIGIIRIDITASCRSRVLRSRSARPAASCWYSAVSTCLLFCASMACVMTSSPTRLISWSTFSTDTRSVATRFDDGHGLARRRTCAAVRCGRGGDSRPRPIAATSSATALALGSTASAGCARCGRRSRSPGALLEVFLGPGAWALVGEEAEARRSLSSASGSARARRGR